MHARPEKSDSYYVKAGYVQYANVTSPNLHTKIRKKNNFSIRYTILNNNV